MEYFGAANIHCCRADGFGREHAIRRCNAPRIGEHRMGVYWHFLVWNSARGARLGGGGRDSR